MASKAKGGLLLGVLLVCLALGLPGAHAAAARDLKSMKEAPTGCINIVNNCPVGYSTVLSYRDGKAYSAIGYYNVKAGASTGRICYPVMNRDYGFYVHFTAHGNRVSQNSDQSAAYVNMPDPQGNREIGGCAMPNAQFMTRFISGTTPANAVFRNMRTGKQGKCSTLGGVYLKLEHVYLEEETLTLC